MNGRSDICAEVRERFSALAENDLADALRRETEAHLAGCAACRAARARFEETIAALGDLPRAELPGDLPDRIDRAVDRLQATTAARPRSFLIRHAVAAFLVAGIVVAIVRVIPGPRGPLPLETLEKEQAVREVSEPAAIQSRDAGQKPLSRSEARPAVADLKAANKAAPAPTGKAMRAVPEDAAGGPKKKPADADLHASPAERVDRLTERMREAERAAPGAGESPRTLLLSARGDRQWMSAIRDLALARPEDLAAAWETLAGDERGRVLDAWRRAAPPPNLARDLRRALGGAGADREREMITTLLEAAPP